MKKILGVLAFGTVLASLGHCGMISMTLASQTPTTSYTVYIGGGEYTYQIESTPGDTEGGTSADGAGTFEVRHIDVYGAEASAGETVTYNLFYTQSDADDTPPSTLYLHETLQSNTGATASYTPATGSPQGGATGVATISAPSPLEGASATAIEGTDVSPVPTAAQLNYSTGSVELSGISWTQVGTTLVGKIYETSSPISVTTATTFSNADVGFVSGLGSSGAAHAQSSFGETFYFATS